MSNLFIIGNGFDISHGLKTTYEDFHQYLKSQYPQAIHDRLVLPEGSLMPDGGIGYDDADVVSVLLYLISCAEANGGKWSDLENSLGVLDFTECFDDLPEVLDRDGERNLWHEAYNNEDRASDLVTPIVSITCLFADWIDTIDVSRAGRKPEFLALVDRHKDYFLTFNYTETLELLYRVNRVCHIHGKRGENLVFGHGNDTDRYEDNMSRYTGAEDALQQIHLMLKKHTKAAISRSGAFFAALAKASIHNIYSYGFSFSKPDRAYIREVCRRVSTEGCTWFLNDFDVHDCRRQFRAIIRDCGFRGRFSTYHA